MLHEIDLSRTGLSLLVLFEVVLQEHVGRAAQRLSLSPSAVSHCVGRLRAQLNDPLFLNIPRGIVPRNGPSVSQSRLSRFCREPAQPFDPATSRRRFIIGSPDGSAIAPLPALLSELATKAPGIDMLQSLEP